MVFETCRDLIRLKCLGLSGDQRQLLSRWMRVERAAAEQSATSSCMGVGGWEGAQQLICSMCPAGYLPFSPHAWPRAPSLAPLRPLFPRTPAPPPPSNLQSARASSTQSRRMWRSGRRRAPQQWLH